MQNKKIEGDRTNSMLLVTYSKNILILLLLYFTDNKKKYSGKHYMKFSIRQLDSIMIAYVTLRRSMSLACV